MKSFFLKISALLLGALVLLSTVSFTFEKHFCGEKLIDVSLFLPAEKCYTEQDGDMMKSSCCKDEIDIVKGQDELKFSDFEDFNFDQQQFLVAITYSYLILFESLDNLIIPHKDYTPPNLVTDIQILDQVFII